MRIFFPIHLDGSNRGCEAIAKGTAMILNEKKENLIGLCTDVELDKRLGVDKFVTLQCSKKNSIYFKIINKLYRSVVHEEWARKAFVYSRKYKMFLDQIKRDDIMLSTGGDMMCYDDNEVVYTVDYLHKRGIRSVLWGCSIGEENLSPRKLYALKQFSMIYARETLTKEILNKHGFDNVVVYPDPAFVLKPEECSLPKCFEKGEVIGLNLSNFVLGSFNLDSVLGQDIIALIDSIISRSDRHVLLIPHVMMSGQDDRIVSRIVHDRYKYTGRVHLLDSDHLNYCKIRHIISKCKMFIGARTHSVISAYSTYTPAIAIGYSIKSRGIAKDVGMTEKTIVNSKHYKFGALLHTYDYVEKHSDMIRGILQEKMPNYRNSTYGIRDIIG